MAWWTGMRVFGTVHLVYKELQYLPVSVQSLYGVRLPGADSRCTKMPYSLNWTKWPGLVTWVCAVIVQLVYSPLRPLEWFVPSLYAGLTTVQASEFSESYGIIHRLYDYSVFILMSLSAWVTYTNVSGIVHYFHVWVKLVEVSCGGVIDQLIEVDDTPLEYSWHWTVARNNRLDIRRPTEVDLTDSTGIPNQNVTQQSEGANQSTVSETQTRHYPLQKSTANKKY